jgi:predicted Zn-dependent protease
MKRLSFSLSFYGEEYEPALYGILLHELGHALGLEHEEESIMNEKYDGIYNKTSIQMESFNNLIQKYQLNPCDIN